MENGLGGIIYNLPSIPQEVKLYFHPFRYYVLYHLDRILRLHIHPMQMLISIDRYPQLLEQEIKGFTEWSSSDKFIKLVQRWNNVTALSIAAEPYTFAKLFGIIKYSAFSDRETQSKLINQHWNEFKEALVEIGYERIETIRDELCFNAELLDPNKFIHLVTRLTSGEERITKVKGRLGGAMYLLTMAEMLRRSIEEAFGVQLPEEDELGFGAMIADVKNRLYGSNRILDNRDARDEFLRKQGLDYGVRLRWYVEGDTEYNAIESVLGRYCARLLIYKI